jgi:choline kinase
MAIEQALGADTDVLVVVGHAADRVERYCAAYAQRSSLRPRLVRNDQHASRNNWYSLLVGLDALEGSLSDDDVVVILNSDLFGMPAWIAALVEAAGDLRDAPGFLAVDVVRPLTPEAMKVGATPVDASGRRWCTSIGKIGVPDPVGEYVGMSALAPSGRGLVHDALRRLAAREDRADAWYEEAFQEVASLSPCLMLWPTPSSAWVEIDDADDLRAANRLAATLLTAQATASPATPRPSARPAPRSRES